jgi:hypothetical protein
VIGTVDEHNRALLNISVASQAADPGKSITAWIDTAFDGYLVFSHELIKQLHLESLAKTEAILAGGSIAVFDTFLCYIEWFGLQLPCSGDGERRQISPAWYGPARTTPTLYRLSRPNCFIGLAM